MITLDENIVATIAAGGFIACLKYLLIDRRCPYDSRTTFAAAENNNLDCLIFAHEYGCPFDPNIIHAVCISNTITNIKKKDSAGTEYWGTSEHLECIDYIIRNNNNNNTYNKNLIKTMVKWRLPNTLKYFYENVWQFTANDLQYLNQYFNTGIILQGNIAYKCPITEYINSLNINPNKQQTGITSAEDY